MTDPVTAPLRVAVVGLGWAGRSIWLPRLREHPRFVVTAIVDPDPAARTAATQDLATVPDGAGGAGHGPAGTGSGQPEPTVFADVNELAAAGRARPDLAVVAVPNNRHADIAERLLAAGIPVFLEKPVCLSSAEADRLAAAEQAGDATLLAGSAARYRADVSRLYEVAAGLGAIRHVDLAWVRARGIPDAGGWFTRREQSGGGALVDLGWHLLDTLTPLLGAVRFREVIGTTSDDFVNDGAWAASWRHEDEPQATSDSDGRLPGRAGGDVEDTARGFLVTEHGTSVALRASWASHEARDLTAITVEGAAGTTSLRCTFGFGPNRQDRSVLTLTRTGQTSPVTLPDEPIGTEYRRQLDELPAMLADPASRGRAIAEVRPTIAAIERFYDSARSSRRAPDLVPAGR
ncbi:Gfo/Idh/MocA family protein [Frankia sp. R82]|uniref:Gfo/Idh/MocA family protein n=1 Tax=Frankia sp. R82 TaxID=2950553 RepID=UPI0020433A0A|nr:Gfo/Idh/MocA family oxidoreductase [Frankia sp. R82]MCM3885478.1 Gfo/Idh/MocA family oxidoreductase [Frankia sp. R82]